MTTPAKPERMTEAKLAGYATECQSIDYTPDACEFERSELLRELRRARSEEERLTRTLALEEKFGEALAHELGRHIEARLETERDNARLRHECNLSIEAHHNATAERDAAREASEARRVALLDKADEAVRERMRSENAEAELAAAREEAERLRASKKRIAEGLTKLRAKVERGLNLAEYLRALNELEPDHADE